LYLTNLNLKFKSVIKDRLFYNRFEYAIGFHLDEVSCLRELDHTHIDSMIERRRAWREIAQLRIRGAGNLFGKSNTILSHNKNKQKEITEKTVSDLHELANLLLTTQCDFKLVVSINQAHVYTNDLTLIDQLTDLSGATQKEYSKAIICRPKNTIKLKEPKHQFRSYVKRTKLTTNQKNNLINFLNNYADIRISPAFSVWSKTLFNRTQDYFFIDHDTESWLTMLSLVHPGLIRKTMQIIPAK